MQWHFPPSWCVPAHRYTEKRTFEARESGSDVHVGLGRGVELHNMPVPGASQLFQPATHRCSRLLATTNHPILARAKQGKHLRSWHLGLPAAPSPSRDTPDHCQTFRPVPGLDHALGSRGQRFLVSLTGNRRRTRMSSVALPHSLSVQYLG